jgi:hypothetical protein
MRQYVHNVHQLEHHSTVRSRSVRQRQVHVCVAAWRGKTCYTAYLESQEEALGIMARKARSRYAWRALVFFGRCTTSMVFVTVTLLRNVLQQDDVCCSWRRKVRMPFEKSGIWMLRIARGIIGHSHSTLLPKP